MIDRQRNILNGTNSPANKGIICPFTAKLRCNLQSASKHTVFFLLIIIYDRAFWLISERWRHWLMEHYGSALAQSKPIIRIFSFYEPLPRVTYINTLLLVVWLHTHLLLSTRTCLRYDMVQIWYDFLVICKRITLESYSLVSYNNS